MNKDCKVIGESIHRSNGKKTIELDLSIVRELDQLELKEFRDRLLGLIYEYRSKRIVIDLDSLRLQSIIYNAIVLGPKILQINISNTCNYRCKFCLSHSPLIKAEDGDNPIRFMPLSDIKRIIEQAKILGTENIYICGEGETLIHPDIIEVISYIAEHKLNITIMTNASNSGIVSEMLSLSPNPKLSFLVNLSACNRDMFNKIYGVEKRIYDAVLDNIGKLIKKYPVALSYIVFKDTYKDILTFVKLAGSLGVKIVKLKQPILYKKAHKKIMLSNRELKEVIQSLGDIKAIAKKYSIKLDFKELIDLYFPKLKRMRIDKCYNGWFFAKIQTNGDVYICCKENRPIGRVNKGNFKDVLFSPEYINRILEGKRYVDLRSLNWRKCGFCVERDRNHYLKSLLK